MRLLYVAHYAPQESVIYTRREVLKAAVVSPMAGLLRAPANSSASNGYPSRRPQPGRRKFVSRSVEQTVVRVKALIADPELAWMFENSYPNTLDTTIETRSPGRAPDTFIITGDTTPVASRLILPVALCAFSQSGRRSADALPRTHRASESLHSSGLLRQCILS